MLVKKLKRVETFYSLQKEPEADRGNQLLPFKGGSFKVATKSKCPIVPCALVDSFKPFDEKSTKPVTVTVIYLKPIYYEEYQSLKTNEIAEFVRTRIIQAIEDFLAGNDLP